MENIYYRQCVLRKNNTVIVSWLPEKYAKRGKYVKLKDIDGWKIIEVGHRMKGEETLERSQDYKHQRKASDI